MASALAGVGAPHRRGAGGGAAAASMHCASLRPPLLARRPGARPLQQAQQPRPAALTRHRRCRPPRGSCRSATMSGCACPRRGACSPPSGAPCAAAGGSGRPVAGRGRSRGPHVAPAGAPQAAAGSGGGGAAPHLLKLWCALCHSHLGLGLHVPAAAVLGREPCDLVARPAAAGSRRPNPRADSSLLARLVLPRLQAP